MNIHTPNRVTNAMSSPLWGILGEDSSLHQYRSNFKAAIESAKNFALISDNFKVTGYCWLLLADNSGSVVNNSVGNGFTFFITILLLT